VRFPPPTHPVGGTRVLTHVGAHEWMFCACGPVSQALTEPLANRQHTPDDPRLTPQDLATLLGRAGSRGFTEEILLLMSEPIDNGT
jgi:hypothetical protein